MNVFRALATIMHIRRLYRRLRPDLVHHVALVPAVVGSIAALGLRMERLNAFAGLGYVFTSTAAKARAVRLLAAPLLGWMLSRPDTSVLVQNPDDEAVALGLGVPPEKIALIPGSGVDVDLLKPLPEPAGPFTVGFIGRLLDDKGVRTLVRAHEILLKRGMAIRTLIAGEPDPSNPASIPNTALTGWRGKPNLELLGHVGDVRTVWAQAHVAALPSRREGLPKSLLEAAACGRPLIATDVPGCREIARQGVTGLLVPPDDPVALADAIVALMENEDMRRGLGQAARKLVSSEFSSARIGRDIVALYTRLLAGASGTGSQLRERAAS
jgi:glycosyltransferase involved in cell wall biosynthesis